MNCDSVKQTKSNSYWFGNLPVTAGKLIYSSLPFFSPKPVLICKKKYWNFRYHICDLLDRLLPKTRSLKTREYKFWIACVWATFFFYLVILNTHEESTYSNTHTLTHTRIPKYTHIHTGSHFVGLYTARPHTHTTDILFKWCNCEYFILKCLFLRFLLAHEVSQLRKKW